MASLRPVLKYGNEIYTAPLNGQHLDALPAHLAAEFYRRAMRGDDLSEYRFGFVDGEGNFPNREAALRYAIDAGLIQPHEAGRGTLTSGMLSPL
jgi:hypothetical protein